ncbi:fluoride efflux transporter FluC [Nonomuraea sp. ZG12]|uniref:fluoride efflux transporter FluC n=1 Tax=Nonomuraea sp. ZG12 TaxID=3452207 RepID=UPI003F8B140E
MKGDALVLDEGAAVGPAVPRLAGANLGRAPTTVPARCVEFILVGGHMRDSGVDPRPPADRAEQRPSPWPVLAAVSAGGVLGSLARYGISTALPYPPGTFAWPTFLVNVSGCLLIGVLMVLVGELWSGRRLLRPFLGVGVLGGYTTFSTYVVDIHLAMAAGRAGTALVYLVATLLAAMLAVWAGAALTGRAVAVVRASAVLRAAEQEGE